MALTTGYSQKIDRGVMAFLPLKTAAHITGFTPTNGTESWLKIVDSAGVPVMETVVEGHKWEHLDNNGKSAPRWELSGEKTSLLPDPDEPSNKGRRYTAEVTIKNGDDLYEVMEFPVTVENSRHVHPSGALVTESSAFVKSSDLMTNGSIKPSLIKSVSTLHLNAGDLIHQYEHVAGANDNGVTDACYVLTTQFSMPSDFALHHRLGLFVTTADEQISQLNLGVLYNGDPESIQVSAAVNSNAVATIRWGNKDGRLAIAFSCGQWMATKFDILSRYSLNIAEWDLETAPSWPSWATTNVTPQNRFGEIIVAGAAYHSTSSNWTVISDERTKDVVSRLKYSAMAAFVSTFTETPIWTRNGKLGTRAGDVGYLPQAQMYELAINNLIAALPEDERADLPENFAEAIGAVVRRPIWVDSELNQVEPDTEGATLDYLLSANFDFGYMVFTAFSAVSEMYRRANQAALAEALSSATDLAGKVAAIEAWANG